MDPKKSPSSKSGKIQTAFWRGGLEIVYLRWSFKIYKAKVTWTKKVTNDQIGQWNPYLPYPYVQYFQVNNFTKGF